MTVDNVIEDFYDDVEELVKIFGSLEDILFFLYKKGRLDEIDPFDDRLEEYETQILYYIMTELGDDEVMNYIISQLMEDDFKANREGGFDLTINGPDDLAELFNEMGDPNDRSVVKNVMGEDWFEAFGYIEVDFQGDLLENLNEENIGKLKDLLISENVKIDLNELLEISTQDEDNPKEFLYQLFGEESDIVKLSSDNIDRVFNNFKILDYLIMTYYSEIQIELENLYNRSYNDAWVEDVTNQAWGELSTYFDVKDRQWVPNPLNLKSHYFKMKINDGVVEDAIISFLRENSNLDYNSNNSISDLSGLIGLLQSLMEEGVYEFLTIGIPDYPDYSLVVKYINLGFDDYL